MYGSRNIDDEVDDFFKDFNQKQKDFFKPHNHRDEGGVGAMETVTIVCSVIGIVVVLVLLCRCCQRRNRGRILSPPPPQPPAPMVQVPAPAPYPQQQFVAVPYPGPAPYPSYPAPYPAVPLAAPVGPPPTAPDLTAVYGMPPAGWNTQALPPSYEQATRTEVKDPPYNPAHPH